MEREWNYFALLVHIRQASLYSHINNIQIKMFCGRWACPLKPLIATVKSDLLLVVSHTDNYNKMLLGPKLQSFKLSKNHQSINGGLEV